MRNHEFVSLRDRQDAGKQLAQKLLGYDFHSPVILAIPRGGVVIGGVLAEILGAELDVVIARKLRVPQQPELAFGGLAEDGSYVLDHHLVNTLGLTQDQVQHERDYQKSQIQQRVERFRRVRPLVEIKDRSAIITDDGIATGATIQAAIRTVRERGPRELIVAVPIAPPGQIRILEKSCDKIVCLYTPEGFASVGQYYQNFEPITDQEALRECRPEMVLCLSITRKGLLRVRKYRYVRLNDAPPPWLVQDSYTLEFRLFDPVC